MHVGIDRDGDGQLGDAEISATERRCGHVLIGPVTIESAEDLAALADVRVIAGGLTVANTQIRAIAQGTIHDNVRLPTCAAHALLDQTNAVIRSVRGNDDNAPCK